MSVQLTCPACEATFNVSASLLGKTLRCKSCKVPFKARAFGTSNDSPARRLRDEDDDEKPVRRPKKDVPPPTRSQARDEDDEDDEDERLARKSGRKAKKKSSVPFILGSLAAFLLLIGAVIWVVVGSGYFDKKPADGTRDNNDGGTFAVPDKRP